MAFADIESITVFRAHAFLVAINFERFFRDKFFRGNFAKNMRDYGIYRCFCKFDIDILVIFDYIGIS